MKKLILTLATLALLSGSLLADTFRVHSIRGSGREITIQADSSSEARRVVMEMFGGAVVTNVYRRK